MAITKKGAQHHLASLPGWQLEAGAIAKKFVFKDFNDAFDFMSLCAKVAEEMQHHPDWTNSYNKVDVRLTTHSASGLTKRDFELARHMNEAEKALLG